MMCARFDFSGMPEIYRLQVCVDLSFIRLGYLWIYVC